MSRIHARYDAALERERAQRAVVLAELDRRRALVIPVDPDAGGGPIHRVDRRDGIVACRTMCGARPGAATDPARAHTAQCLRDICLPAYADALVKTYAHADIAWVATQLSLSIDADLESVLARANNQAVLADIERQAAVLAHHYTRARDRIEQQRQHDLRASTLQREAEIATGRAARRARVKAAADAFAADARGQPAAPATASRAPTSDPPGAARPSATASDPPGAASPSDCADPSCEPPPPARSSVTCGPDADITIARAGDPARTTGAASTPRSEARVPIDCSDPRDCPSGMSCDLSTGVCCTTVVR